MLRAKFHINSVVSVRGQDGKYGQEIVKAHAVRGDTDDNREWAKFTPAGQLELTIDNPAAFGRLLPGQQVYLDITLAEEASTPAG